jgi:phage gpG-like protein
MELDDLFKGFDSIVRRGRNMTPVWQNVRKAAIDDQKRIQKAKEGTEGKWPRRAKAARSKRSAFTDEGLLRTSKKKKRRRGRLLGKLVRAVGIRYNRSTLMKISHVRWSGVHQEGGSAGNEAEIPQREHVYFTREFLEIVVQEMQKHLVKDF